MIVVNTMPQNVTNYVGRRRGSRWHNGRAGSLVQHTTLVNGIIHYKDCPAVCNGTCENTAAGTPITSKPHDMVNGHIPAFRKITKAAAIRTHSDRKGTVSPVSSASSANWVSAGISGVLVNRTTSVNFVSLPNGSYEMAPEINLSSPVKRHKKKKKWRRKKSRTEVACPTSVHFLMPSEEQEDWDNEIQEVTLPDRGKTCLGIKPYGAEDVISFALRGLRLNQKDSADLPVTARYIPAVHHPCPVKLSCYSIPTEADQFADADE